MDSRVYIQPDFNEKSVGSKKKRYYKGVAVLILVIVALFIIKAGFFGKKIDINNGNSMKKVTNALAFGYINKEDNDNYNSKYVMPKKESDRLDILVLGMRGEEQINQGVGALLTDTMLVFSFDKTTKKASLVSIPRDLYVIIQKGVRKDKINAAYEIGGANLVKKLVSEISGVYIDNVIIFDFSSFQGIIDQLGGIDVQLDKPFEEKNQWGFDFKLPAGVNHLDGQTALYYVRSRYSSTDFDRSARQQQVIWAIKDKIVHLNLLSDPIKAVSVLNTLRNDIQTDLNIWDVSTLFSLAKDLNPASQTMKKYIISTDNLVDQKFVGGAYVLTPKGDNFDQIKKLFQDVIK